MMLPAYGGAITGLHIARFADIRLEGNQTPPTTRSTETVQGAEALQQAQRGELNRNGS